MPIRRIPFGRVEALVFGVQITDVLELRVDVFLVLEVLFILDNWFFIGVWLFILVVHLVPGPGLVPRLGNGKIAFKGLLGVQGKDRELDALGGLGTDPVQSNRIEHMVRVMCDDLFCLAQSRYPNRLFQSLPIYSHVPTLLRRVRCRNGHPGNRPDRQPRRPDTLISPTIAGQLGAVGSTG